MHTCSPLWCPPTSALEHSRFLPFLLYYLTSLIRRNRSPLSCLLLAFLSSSYCTETPLLSYAYFQVLLLLLSALNLFLAALALLLVCPLIVYPLTRVPARGSTSTKEGGLFGGASSLPPSSKIRRQPPSSGLLRRARKERIRYLTGVWSHPGWNRKQRPYITCWRGIQRSLNHFAILIHADAHTALKH